MKPTVSAFANGDDAFIVWKTAGAIQGCLGFAIERTWLNNASHPEKNQTAGFLPNRVGFKDDNPAPNTVKPSNEWPFQRYTWTDHGVNNGDIVRYRVIPVLRNAAGVLAPDMPNASAPAEITLTSDRGSGFSHYYNRGLVMSQFMSRIITERFGAITDETLQEFKGEIGKHESDLRKFLTGDLGAKLLDLLAEAKANDGHVFAALYELSDDALIAALRAMAGNAHVVLSNGSVQHKGDDGNSESRATLNANGVEVHDRMVAPKPLGHNKFLVICDKDKNPTAVWTGSTNWASTGLCTQINNGLLIEDPDAAGFYKKQWEELRDAGSDYPDALVDGNSAPREVTVQGKNVDIWFSRTRAGEDRAALDDVIANAKDGILFLMFMPGATGVDGAINAKLAEAPGLYVKGVVSTMQNPNTGTITVVNDGKPVDSLAVIQPDGIHRDFAQWVAEVTRGMFLTKPGVKGVGHAIVHSKMMVIDPFGVNPVVVTGSHNFSKPASESNDENFVIVRGHAKLAEAAAVHILSVYNHYRFRAFINKNPGGFSGLASDDSWQSREDDGVTQREQAFWLGGKAAAAAH